MQVPRSYEKKPQSYWDAMITPKKEEPETNAPELKIQPIRPVLTSDEEYDYLQPEERIRAFCAFIRDALARYESNKDMLVELEQRMQDILHFAEMSKDKDVCSGYKLYKELCQIRRQRRACKNEIELLSPVYELFHGTKLLDQLAYVQGGCRKVKQAISNKGYSIRTDALDEFL